MSYMIIDV